MSEWQESGHKTTLRRCHATSAMLEGTTASGASKRKSSWLHSRFKATFSGTAAKLKHAVTLQSGHDSIDDSDKQAAQEQEAYSSARLAVLHQCELLHPIVYDTLNTRSLYSSNNLTKLSVAQRRLICSYVLQHGHRGTTIKAKSALHYFYLGYCRVLFLH